MLASAPAACTEPFGLGQLAGLYVLSRVASDTLPALLFANSNVTVRVLADTLRLGPTGAGSESTREVVQQTSPTSAPDTVSFDTGLSVRLEQRAFAVQLEIAILCPPNSDCAPPPHMIGRLVPYGIEVDQASGLRVPLLYRRVASVE